jgi:hypothetical protein
MPLADPETQPITQKPLPPAARIMPAALAKWIDAAVPCIVGGAQSQKVTDAVLKRLRRDGVTDQVISDAIGLSLYKFGMTPLVVVRTPGPISDRDDGSMSARDPGEDPLVNLRQAAKIYEQQYRAAMHSRNLTLLRAIAKAIFDLLIGSGTPNEDTRQEKERLEKLREEIEVNAPTASRCLRLAGGPPNHGNNNRVRQIGPHSYLILDEEVVEEDAVEGAEEDAEEEVE